MTTAEEKIAAIKKLAKQKGVSEQELSKIASEQKKFDPNRFLDNTLNILDTLKDVQKGVGGTLTDKEGNLIGIRDADGRPDQKIRIAGMSPPVFFVVSVSVILIASYGIIRYMRK
jgi:hypothetical protein